MRDEGPALAELLRHLRDAPPSFHRAPRTDAAPGVDTYALVCDFLADIGVQALDRADARRRLAAQSAHAGPNALVLVHAVVWLLSHPSLAAASDEDRERRAKLLLDGLGDLGKTVQGLDVFRDDERGEELVRRVLVALGQRPRGETQQVALDRLAAIDSVERARVLVDARRAREKKVLEEMRRREAEEAAAKASRE